jgi:chromosome segregation ATPase
LEKDLENATEKLRLLNFSVQTHSENAGSLEARIEELEDTLEKQTPTIDHLELERQTSNERLAHLDKQLDDLKQRCDGISVSEDSLKQKLSETEVGLEFVRTDRDRLKEMVASKSTEKLEEERDRLTIVIAQLEEELREASNMVQTYVTDGSSERASGFAAQGLRDEIGELKDKIDDYRQYAEDERAAREAADLEIARLRDDIAALVSLGDYESASDEIQMRSGKASEKLKRKERLEIDQLRKSLYRSIEELELARAAEKKVNENLSKVRLQAAVGEQEIISAKSEIHFLTQALDELRLSEEGKRASLEYRIGSLEDENDVLRKYHSGELENSRNELAQVSMEKDRILHQLKESEKTNAALVFATSKAENQEIDEIDDLEGEVAKLRIENAHLLTVAADDKARAERRLREVLAAQRAIAEADTILEHELRIAAEASIQSLKMELEELKIEIPIESGKRDEKSRNNKGQASVDALVKEIDSLKQELQKLKSGNSSLKAKMEQAATKAQVEIDAMTEECRKAQSKAHKLEREGRFNAAVKSEVSRLRMSPSMTPEKREPPQDDWMLVNSDPSLDRLEPSLTSAEGYDLIRKQKEEIQEERKMYLEFLSEHDDLLALLAQHDLERACLKEALSEAIGEDAVDEVVREAEEKSMGQFGKIIKVA